jgi:hypothetical protein
MLTWTVVQMLMTQKVADTPALTDSCLLAMSYAPGGGVHHEKPNRKVGEIRLVFHHLL